jgi:hypothetical protein
MKLDFDRDQIKGVPPQFLSIRGLKPGNPIEFIARMDKNFSVLQDLGALTDLQAKNLRT